MESFAKNYTVHKFGGSSLANTDRFLAVKSLLKEKNQIIVVSAIKGTTCALQLALNQAKERKPFLHDLMELEKSHLNLIKSLLPEAKNSEIMSLIGRDFIGIRNILHTVLQMGSFSTEIQDFVLGFGEQWSAQIMAHYLSQYSNVKYLDASTVLQTYYQNNIICIDWKKSQQELNLFMQDNNFENLVITGFIASTIDGKKTTLGRNGSDFSAAVFAKLFKAESLYIWTDVDGIYSANPDKVCSAFPIPSMSYKEALELAYFGAKVLHPRTISPALESNIPIFIKNSFKPEAKGTHISNSPLKSQHLIKGVTSIDDIALFNIEGAGMIGVSGIAARIFNIIQQENISVILISQASSEYSICFAVSGEHTSKTINLLKNNLQIEISRGQIERISVDNNCAILAIVGDEMVGAIGISGKLCSTLSRANINIAAIAQGSSERNISVVIHKKDATRALKAVHAGFYLSHKTISIGLIGAGSVGGTLLDQIYKTCEHLKNKYKVNLSIRGIMNSKKMLLSHDSIPLENWRNKLAESNIVSNVSEFANHIISDDVAHSVIIDCTADQGIANQYLNFINKGIHIITPNKHANGGDLNYYKELKSLARQKNCHYYYEATVCAGLPVINTLQDILNSGDEVLAIEGIVSGTLSFIFNELAKGKKFSDIVHEAKKCGFTEPDPREDLSGKDVARKLICLAREIGMEISLADINVHNLVPESLKNCSLNEFLERLSECDKEMDKFIAQAKTKNEKLCYVGSINQNGKVSVSIGTYPQSHPFNRLQSTDNMIIFNTQRYNSQPLVIQGPGAGAEVTAAGIFADLLRLSSSLA